MCTLAFGFGKCICLIPYIYFNKHFKKAFNINN